jgi:hypothetical protein
MPEARTLDGRRAVAFPEALLAEVLLKVFQLLRGRRYGKLRPLRRLPGHNERGASNIGSLRHH